MAHTLRNQESRSSLNDSRRGKQLANSLTVWCQWDDLEIPENTRLTNSPLASMNASQRDEIQIYVPQYMGGRPVLTHIQELKNLEIVQLLMAGFEDALEFMSEGITLCNATGVHNDSTAELTVALTLSSLRGIPDFVRNQEIGVWDHKRNPSLSDKTVGIIGYGSIGKSLDHLLANFPVNIRRFARTAREGVHALHELNTYLPQLDVIILLIPLNSDTEKLFDATRLKLMKDGALLVNVARGGIVDTDALVQELQSGRISAALDVTDPEPLPLDHPLWKLKNCLISPHVGGDSGAFEKRGRRLVEEQLQRLSNGVNLVNVIDWISLK